MHDLIRRYYAQLWNEWDDRAVDELLSADFAFRGSLEQHTSGREQWRGYRDEVRAGAADFHCEIVTLVVERDTAATRLVFSGTHTGTLLGLPATGRAFSYAGTAFFTRAGEELTSAWVLGDLRGLRDQLL